MRHSLPGISIFSSERFAWPLVFAPAKRARNGRLKYAMSENPACHATSEIRRARRPETRTPLQPQLVHAFEECVPVISIWRCR
jgi:hypothetical protein